MPSKLLPPTSRPSSRQPGPAPDTDQHTTRIALDSEAAARLRRAVARLSRRLRRPGLGELTQSQLSALATVSRCMPVRLGDLATREGVSASTLSRLVDSLVERGMVTRVRDPDDARSSQVSATADGLAFLEDLRRNGTTLIYGGLRSLGDTDRGAVLAALPALERLADAAENQ
ncbi:MAG TPA: MarR family transcriptional regulator [Candidatus Dormibacteraeota bacterium]|nr:MarR family transcriptional regulator [Candidatus Dormibacteraeota bacterium]